MKRIISFAIIFICVSVFIVVGSEAKGIGKAPGFSFDKKGNYVGFTNLSSNYTIEKAKSDGYFVMQNLKIIANKNVWENFVKTASRNENTSIRIVTFFTEDKESPYFLDLFYNDGHYYLFDSSAKDLKKQPYSHLLTLEGQFGIPKKASGVVVLTNDRTLTFDKVMKSLISSNLNYIKSVSKYKIVMFK